MTTITTRSGKGSPLTNDEVDANFTNLNDDKIEASGDSMTGDLSFGDNDKAVFGAGSDLQIYHDGSNSYIQEAGSGNLYIQGSNAIRLRSSASLENMLEALENGAVTLYHNNSAKLATTSTGIDVTGTVTADGITSTTGTSMTQLTVNGIGAIESGINFANGGTTYGQIYFNNVSPYDMSVLQQYSTGSLIFGTNDTERMRIDSSGQVGIGTSSPQELLHLSATTPVFRLEGGSRSYQQFVSGTDFVIRDVTATANRITLDSSGNVGIGVSSLVTGSSRRVLQVSTGSDGGQIAFADSTTEAANPRIFATNKSDLKLASANSGASTIQFITGTTTPAERMRIDSSGNLLVGTTTYNSANQGILLGATGVIYSTGTSGISASFGRNTTDGSIVNFRKDNSTVGSIGSRGSGTSFITLKTSSGSGAGLTGTDNGILPMDESALADNNTDLGSSSYRFKDLYLSGATKLFSGTNSPATNSTLGDIDFGARTDGTVTAKIRGIAGDNGNGTDGQITFFTADNTASQAAEERMRIDASGNFMVGGTSARPAEFSHPDGFAVRRDVNGQIQNTVTDAQCGIFNRDGTDGDIFLFRKEGSGVGSIGTNGNLYVQGPSSSSGVEFANSHIRPFRDGARIDDAIDLGIDGGRFKDLYLSGGVYLGGTGSANKLDDYETGTFTPVASGTWTTTPTSLSGRYIKVGKFVWIEAKMTGGVKASSTSGYLTGLPFSTNNSFGGTGSVVDSAVTDHGSCLFQNTDRIWLTDTDFGTGTVYVTGGYEVA